MKDDQKLAWARETARDSHNERAGWFVQAYKEQESQHGHYGSAFLYGRHQLDKHFSAQVAKLHCDARVLDVGCGTGEQMYKLRQKGFDVFGVEPAPQMRLIAQSKLSAKSVAEGSILQLPFPDNYFDFVYALEVLRYLGAEDNRKGLAEIRRVLKPGGTFFGTFVNRYAADGFVVLTQVRRLRHRWLGKAPEAHTEFETPGKLAKSFARAGFSSSEAHGCMVAGLRLTYKLGRRIGIPAAKLTQPVDATLSDAPWLRPLAGHLIGIARK